MRRASILPAPAEAAWPGAMAVEEGGLDPALSRAVWAAFAAARQSGGAVAGGPRRKPAGGHATGAANHPYRRARPASARGLVRLWSPVRSRKARPRLSFGQLWLYAELGASGSAAVLRWYVGTHREASSGCYTAMALYPLSSAGTNWCCGSRSA
jgi:tRNA(Met) cytidine acetyltransferase